MRRILQAARTFADHLERGSGDIVIGLPVDELDATGCGFPSMATQMRAIGIAVGLLPDDRSVSLVPRVFGQTPMIILPDPEPDDMPDPAPAGFQIQVNAGPRRRAK